MFSIKLVSTRRTERPRGVLLRSVAPLAMLALLPLAACSPERGAAATAEAAEASPAAALGGPAPTVVTVTAADFYFKAPSTIPAGMTTIRMENQGAEMHHVQLVRIAEGHTLKELMDAVGTGHHIPEWVTVVGGPNAPAPGAASEVTLDLEPGNYAMLCFIPSADGVPHLMKGMVLPITVTPGSGTRVGVNADLTMKLVDYGYELSEELRAGRRTIRVENAAEQPHEVFILQLAPGKTAHDMLRWMEKQQGPPPGKPVGGTTFIANGEVNYVTADFEPGRYALYCFVPDHKDGRPHVAHGMVREIEVR